MNQATYLARRATLTVLAFCLSILAWADEYPSRPIRLIVGFSPGGAADSVGRALAEGLSLRLGQPVVVENRSGANGNLAADYTAKAAPDGYTLYFPSVGHAVNASLYKKLGHDPVRDFTPIGKVFAAPNLLVVPIKSPHRSVADLIAYARSNPGRLSFASSGAGTSVHLSAELFMHITQVQMVHIPYKGTGSAMPDLISGTVDLSFPNLPSSLPLVKSGQLRALGVTTNKRSSAAPEIPTIAEAGVSGYDMSTWYGLVGPARMPVDIIQRLNRELQAVLQMPSFRERLLAQGADPTPGSADEFGRFLESEIERWRILIRQAGVTLN